MEHRYGEYKQVNCATVNRCMDEVLRLRAAMAKAAQRAEDWPDSNDDPAEVLADCANMLYDALGSPAAEDIGGPSRIDMIREREEAAKEIERQAEAIRELQTALMDAIDWNWLDEDKPDDLFNKYCLLAGG